MSIQETVTAEIYIINTLCGQKPDPDNYEQTPPTFFNRSLIKGKKKQRLRKRRSLRKQNTHRRWWRGSFKSNARSLPASTGKRKRKKLDLKDFAHSSFYI